MIMTVKVDVINIFPSIEKSLENIMSKYDFIRNKDILEVQRTFEREYNCRVIKLYSKNLCKKSKYTDVRYWDKIEFDTEAAVTMFLLKWS